MEESRRVWYQKGYHQAIKDTQAQEPVAYLYKKTLVDGFTERTLSFGYEPEFEGKITPLHGITDESTI